GSLPITEGGLPHSEISGSQLTYSSPKHIGVSPVLHRLLVPRHPSCALSNLTIWLNPKGFDRCLASAPSSLRHFASSASISQHQLAYSLCFLYLATDCSSSQVAEQSLQLF